MKKVLSLIMMMTAIFANAQDYSKMSRYVRQLVIQSQEAEAGAQAKGVSPTLSAAQKELVAFVKAPEEAVSDYCIAHQRDIHIVKIPISMLASLSEDERVERIETSENNYHADLDSVASCINIRPLWEGSSPIPQAYDGSGTLVGVIDIGIDYSHPTFRSATDNHLRIVRAWDMLDFSDSQTYNDKAKFPLGKLFTNTDDIIAKGATTDSKTEWHGTHTTAIAAGSGYDTPYRGMAYNADIYSVGCIVGSNGSYLPENITTSKTSTVNTLAFQRIFEYADTIGKPCVINYSISGTQDMTDEDKLMNDYLSELTSKPGHIIVSSIGNNGKKHCYLPKTEDTDTVGGIVSTTEKIFITNISTKKTLTLRITNYTNSDNYGQAREFSLDFKPGNTKRTSRSGLKWNDMTKYSEIKILDSLSVYIYSGNDGFDSERVGYDIFLYPKNNSFSGKKFSVEVIGEDSEAEVFCQYGELISGTNYSPTLTGAQMAGNCGSPGALPSVIGVGYTSYWGQKGLRNALSSMGPTLHGFTKPDITAPGYRVAAAYNSVYRENKGGMSVVRESTYNDKKYGWIRADGTSMSTPAVAGIIALWLEAKPTLTQEEILDVFAHTSRHPVASMEYPNNEYGYGEIDAYKGLLYILGIDHIEGLQTEHLTEAVARPVSGGVTVTLNGNSTTALPCRIYDTAGRLIGQFTVTDAKAFYPLKSGVYAVQVGRLGSTLVRVK